jgi:hypothetical protein
MQEPQQGNGLTNGDNKEKAPSNKIIATVKSLAHIKSYQHAQMTYDNLVGLLKAYFLVGHDLTPGKMLNNTLTHSKKKNSFGNHGEEFNRNMQGLILQMIKEQR